MSAGHLLAAAAHGVRRDLAARVRERIRVEPRGALAVLGADGFTALVAHASESRAIRVLTSLQHRAALTLSPLWLRAERRIPALAVTNGQFLIVRADAYDRLGGFAAVATSLGEDSVSPPCTSCRPFRSSRRSRGGAVRPPSRSPRSRSR